MGLRVAAAIGIVCAIATAHAQRGVPQGGFPTWQERMMLVYVNRGRADPTADLAGCTVCAEKACYTAALTPVANQYVPVGTCNGEVACSCAGGTLTGTTTAVTRTNRFHTVSSHRGNTNGTSARPAASTRSPHRRTTSPATRARRHRSA